MNLYAPASNKQNHLSLDKNYGDKFVSHEKDPNKEALIELRKEELYNGLVNQHSKRNLGFY